MKAVRGATVAMADTEEAVIEATRELIEEIISKNSLIQDNIISILLVSTHDITSAFPGKALREMGLGHLAVIDTLAPNIKEDIPLCIRVMLNIDSSNDINHVYLRDAKKLRPDR
jgi:chorismate mutase|tara:strand:+ start:233 stop:574 length:342 start_codon:yes stop_codon:yes gene_type:complete